MKLNPGNIKCVVFDFGFTLCSDYYFNITPPGCLEWHTIIQERVFHDPTIIDPWLEGDLTSLDIAGVLSRYIPLDIPTILATMEKGCQHLNFNHAVWDFAVSQQAAGRKTALVTDNMDIFTQVVVPAHGLERLFNVILNSSDYHEIRKEFLWPVAFELLGDGIGYANSLLIEDGEHEPDVFRAMGGSAYQYQNDASFLDWLKAVHWSDQT